MGDPRAEAFNIITRMREAFKDEPEEQIEREVNKAIAEVRAELQPPLSEADTTS
ncbi:MAG TPA: hypothetical protein VFE37_16835 [Chloroflexota bacterium]|nr:hypothetical protein [Chloroflexota bacterium]